MRILAGALVLAAVAGAPVRALARDLIEGTWEQVDEDGHVGALVALSGRSGVIQGRIIKVFPEPGESDNPPCTACKGSLKDAPVVGLLIVDGLKRAGDRYAGGTILDPDTGETYSLEARLGPDGTTLDLRAFKGLAVLGQSQTWRRRP